MFKPRAAWRTILDKSSVDPGKVPGPADPRVGFLSDAAFVIARLDRAIRVNVLVARDGPVEPHRHQVKAGEGKTFPQTSSSGSTRGSDRPGTLPDF